MSRGPLNDATNLCWGVHRPICINTKNVGWWNIKRSTHNVCRIHNIQIKDILPLKAVASRECKKLRGCSPDPLTLKIGYHCWETTQYKVNQQLCRYRIDTKLYEHNFRATCKNTIKYATKSDKIMNLVRMHERKAKRSRQRLDVRKSRGFTLSEDIKILTVGSFVLSLRVWRTDGRADRRTDGHNLTTKTVDRVSIV